MVLNSLMVCLILFLELDHASGQVCIVKLFNHFCSIVLMKLHAFMLNRNFRTVNGFRIFTLSPHTCFQTFSDSSLQLSNICNYAIQNPMNHP